MRGLGSIPAKPPHLFDALFYSVVWGYINGKIFSYEVSEYDG